MFYLVATDQQQLETHICPSPLCPPNATPIQINISDVNHGIMIKIDSSVVLFQKSAKAPHTPVIVRRRGGNHFKKVVLHVSQKTMIFLLYSKATKLLPNLYLNVTTGFSFEYAVELEFEKAGNLPERLSIESNVATTCLIT